MPVRKREQRAQKLEEKSDVKRPPLKKINKMPDPQIPDGSYNMKHFMMLDRAQVCPNITREHLRDMLNLPIKTDPNEKGLFEHLVPDEEKEKRAGEDGQKENAGDINIQDDSKK